MTQLAEGKSGLSLVFMHHCDSLKSGHSYQNNAHIMLSDHLEASDVKDASVLPTLADLSWGEYSRDYRVAAYNMISIYIPLVFILHFFSRLFWRSWTKSRSATMDMT